MNRSIMNRQMFREGGSAFPDLSGDGKITQKDILMGRGVIPKPMQEGGMMPPQAEMMAPPPAAMMPPAPSPEAMMPPPPPQEEMMGVGGLQEESGIDPATLEQFMAAAAQNFGDLETAEDYEEMINRLRGDQMPIAGRRQELAEFVGAEDAQRTPESVLAMVQPVLMLNEAEVDQGIGGLAQDQMMEPVTGDMAGGIMSTVAGVEEAPAPVNFREGGAVQRFATENQNRVAGIKPYFEDASLLMKDLIKPSMSPEDLAERKRLNEAQMFFDLAQTGLAIASPPKRSESLAQSIARGATESKLFDRIGARAQAQSELERDIRKEQQAVDLAGLNLAEKLYGTDTAYKTALAKQGMGAVGKLYEVRDKDGNLISDSMPLSKLQANTIIASGGTVVEATVDKKIGSSTDRARNNTLQKLLPKYADGTISKADQLELEQTLSIMYSPKLDLEGRMITPSLPTFVESALQARIDRGLDTIDLPIERDRKRERDKPKDLTENKAGEIPFGTLEFYDSLLTEQGNVDFDSPNWFRYETRLFDPEIGTAYERSFGLGSTAQRIANYIRENVREIGIGEGLTEEGEKLVQADKDFESLKKEIIQFGNELGGVDDHGSARLKSLQDIIIEEVADLTPSVFSGTDERALAVLQNVKLKLGQAFADDISKLDEYGGNPRRVSAGDISKIRGRVKKIESLLVDTIHFEKALETHLQAGKKGRRGRADRDKSTEKDSTFFRQILEQQNEDR